MFPSIHSAPFLAIGVIFFAARAAAAPVSFDREVMPLLEKRCNECHHSEKQRGGLDLTRIETMRRGGDELGAALLPGDPEKSPLIQVLTGAVEPAMPDKDDSLSPEEIDLLRRWIAEGAKDDSPVFASEDVAFFEKEIRPVLVGRCFKCHAGEEAEQGLRLTSRQGILSGGGRGPAAVAEKPEASLLVGAIRHEGELKMPKGGDRLSESQVAAFEEWIRRGLPWPSHEKVLAREKLFSISDADREHWSFRPLPKDLSADWSLDAILAKHHADAGLTPAPETDRHRLLRRVTFDLIGYPPTPEEIETFVNDSSPDAFEKVVTRLLDSPHFGQRWGRHWLDYTRNGANGQPNRGPALDSERYAAWVTRCFNEDRPWDWFTRVHLAGDKMPGLAGEAYSTDLALAAAVPLNGPRTFEEIGTETFVLMDKLDEGVEFLGRSLMGISLECARCHDHKFDPVSQRDYYALLGFFQSSGFAPVPVKAKTPAEAEAATGHYRNLLAEQARLNGFIRQSSLKLNVGGGGRVKQWQKSRIPEITPMDKRLRELELAVFRAELAEAEKNGNDALAGDLRTSISELDDRLKNYQPPEWTGFGSFSGYARFIGGHKSELGLIKRAADLQQTKLVRELEEHLAFWNEERDRWSERSRFGSYAKSDPEIAELAKADDRIKAIQAELVVNGTQPWIEPKETHLYVRADGGWRRAEDLTALDEKAKADGLQFNSNNPDRVNLHPPYVGDSRLLLRGDVLYPDEMVPRGFPLFFGGKTPEIDDGGSGRLQLAEWLTSPGSEQAALVARAAVNRAWQHLFGEALCRTPKELGRLGETPELPEVIDGLAARFVDGGWLMKSLIWEIVLSETYRRSSMNPEGEAAKDPDNRLFARQNVRRLEFEAVANTMAWLKNAKRYDHSADRDADLPGSNYYAEQFDGPSIYDLIERRVASISATQALFLMNNGNASQGIALDIYRRLAKDSKAELLDVLDPLYEIILQRPPSDRERELAKAFLDRRRRDIADSRTIDEIREFASLLICGNECITIE